VATDHWSAGYLTGKLSFRRPPPAGFGRRVPRQILARSAIRVAQRRGIAPGYWQANCAGSVAVQRRHGDPVCPSPVSKGLGEVNRGHFWPQVEGSESHYTASRCTKTVDANRDLQRTGHREQQTFKGGAEIRRAPNHSFCAGARWSTRDKCAAASRWAWAWCCGHACNTPLPVARSSRCASCDSRSRPRRRPCILSLLERAHIRRTSSLIFAVDLVETR